MVLKITPPVIAHRGASGYAPENTLAAFLKAKQLGAKWIEFDVQMTTDGQLVVFHDDEISRTTSGKGAIQDHALSYLKTLDAGSWFDPKFCNEKIPTLKETILFIQEHGLAANIEIKIYDIDAKIIAKKVVELLEENLKKTPFLFFISSFNSHVLTEIKRINVSLPVAHLMHEWTEDWHILCSELNCVAVDLNYEFIDKEKIKEIFATKRLVLAYTVNDSTKAAELFAWGVSAVFSDFPDKILSVL